MLVSHPVEELFKGVRLTGSESLRPPPFGSSPHRILQHFLKIQMSARDGSVQQSVWRSL
jgi:hypothetical protein